MPTTITFLGTSSVTPGAGHDTASFIINRKYLVDTGWNAAIRMLSHGISPLDIEYLFFTHFHQDHYISLPQVLFYRNQRSRDREHVPPLHILGPEEDIERIVNLTTQFIQIEKLKGGFAHPELHPLAAGAEFETAEFRIDTIRSIHPVPGLVYRFTDKETSKSVAFTGDTAYHPPIIELARDADLLIHEASHGPNRPSDTTWGHAGSPDAAEIAKAAKVKRLALIHCAEDGQEAAVDAAREIFENTFWPEDGETVTL